MAEASSTNTQVPSTIDSNSLQCSICHGPFEDPRSLPYFHAFCCECLENWSEACGEDNKTVSCPLCTKVYQIPEEEGVQGFPAQLLVADLQNTADKANQRKSTIGLCEYHDEKKIYFCENCVCPACSDCSILDHTHQGHTFIRLKQAALQQSRSLGSLTGRVKDVEQKYATAVRQLKQAKEDVIQEAESKLKAIQEARNEHMQQMDNLVTLYEQDIYLKKEEKTLKANQLIEKLQSSLDTITSSCKLAANVTESGSDSDIISLYPTLSATLQQLAESEPSPIDCTLGMIQLEPQSTPIYFPSLEQLLCDKLHISPHQPTQVSNDAINLSAGPSATLSTATATPAVASSSTAAKSILLSVSSLDCKARQDPSQRTATDSEGLQAVSSRSTSAKFEPILATGQSSSTSFVDEAQQDLSLKTLDTQDSHLSASFQSSPNTPPTSGKRWKWKVWRTADSERSHPDTDFQSTSSAQPTSWKRWWRTSDSERSHSDTGFQSAPNAQPTSGKRWNWKVWRTADSERSHPNTDFQSAPNAQATSGKRWNWKLWRTADSERSHLNTDFQSTPDTQPTSGKRWRVWRTADSERSHPDTDFQTAPSAQPTSGKGWKGWRTSDSGRTTDSERSHPDTDSQSAPDTPPTSSRTRWKLWSSRSAQPSPSNQVTSRKRWKIWRTTSGEKTLQDPDTSFQLAPGAQLTSRKRWKVWRSYNFETNKVPTWYCYTPYSVAV